MSRIDLEIRRSVKALLALALWIATAAAAGAGGGCETAVPLDLPDRWRGAATERGELLRFDVPSASVVTLDVTAPLAAPVEPELVVLDPGPCGGLQSDAFAYITRTPTHQVLAIRAPGELFIRVAAQDPVVPLGSYKLTANLEERAHIGRFEKTGDPAEDEPDPDPFANGCFRKTGDPAEDEPDPDPFADGCFRKTGDPAEDEPDPDPFADGCFRKTGDPAEDEPDPDPLSGSQCHSTEVDDHGDTLTCATPLRLGDRTGGEISNDWGDDEDVFTFVLTELAAVEIETAGETDTAGTLYDRHAQRLAVGDDGRDGNFRIVRTLVPGRYFVRVEGGHRAQGRYHLSIREVSRR